MPDKASRHPNRPLNMRGAESGRAVALVREVATFGRQGARLTELIERCEIEYPTAHRIIKSLVAHEVLRKDETTRRYHWGNSCTSWALRQSRAEYSSQLRPAIAAMQRSATSSARECAQ